MVRRVPSAVLLAAFLLHGLNGCKRQDAAAASQSTPREATYKLTTCMLEFDKAGFMECLTGSEEELRAAEAFVDYLCAVREFKDAVVGAYGRPGWEVFEKKGGAELTVNITDNRAKLDTVEWKVSGDSAEGKIPGEPQVIHLTHKDGKWCVHAGDILMGGAGDYERFASTWSRTAALLRETKARVGQPGVTPEALDKELGREIMMILLGVAGPQP